jgi:hypothetical protein
MYAFQTLNQDIHVCMPRLAVSFIYDVNLACLFRPSLLLFDIAGDVFLFRSSPLSPRLLAVKPLSRERKRTEEYD